MKHLNRLDFAIIEVAILYVTKWSVTLVMKLICENWKVLDMNNCYNFSEETRVLKCTNICLLKGLLGLSLLRPKSHFIVSFRIFIIIFKSLFSCMLLFCIKCVKINYVQPQLHTSRNYLETTLYFTVLIRIYSSMVSFH